MGVVGGDIGSGQDIAVIQARRNIGKVQAVSVIGRDNYTTGLETLITAERSIGQIVLAGTLWMPSSAPGSARPLMARSALLRAVISARRGSPARSTTFRHHCGVLPGRQRHI